MLFSSIKSNVRLWIFPSFSRVRCRGLACQTVQWTARENEGKCSQ